MVKINFFVLLLLIISFINVIKSNDNLESSKLVHISLLSNWGFTPLHYEASEFINKQDSQLFWRFLDEFINILEYDQVITDKVSYDNTILAASKIMGSTTIQFLKLNLVQRIYSPKVELYRQLSISNHPDIGINNNSSNKINGWIEFNDKKFKEFKEFKIEFDSDNHLNSNSKLETYEFDHFYNGYDESLPILILYADITSKFFKDTFNELKQLRESNKVNFILRFKIDETTEKVNLQGYGFELALKNLEYKVMDDSSIKKDKDASGAQKDTIQIPNEDVSGFNFYTLSQRKPELTQKLSTFRSFLLAHGQAFDELKVWELKDLGIQSSQKIISSSDPLRSLKYISQHFPSIANSLARISMNESLKNEITSNQKALTDKDNVVLLNGRLINVDQINTAQMTDIIQEEMEPLNYINEKLGVSPNKIQLISQQLQMETQVRFKVLPKKSSSLLYLNDLEDFSHKWTRSIEGLSKDSLDENGIQIARNLMTTVIILDPTTPKAAEIATELLYLLQQGTATRFAFVFSTNDNSNNNNNRAHYGDQISAKELSRLFIYIQSHVNVRASLFLFQAIAYFRRMYPSDGFLQRAVVSSSIQAVASQMGGSSKGMSNSLHGSEYDSILGDMNEFIKDFNLDSDSLPSVFLNGRSIDISGKAEFSEILVPQLYKEFNYLKDIYKFGGISEENDDDYYSDILLSKYWKESGLPMFTSYSPEFMSNSVVSEYDLLKRYPKLLSNSKDSTIEDKYLNFLEKELNYYSSNGLIQSNDESNYPITHLIVGDFSKIETLEFSLAMINYQTDVNFKDLSSKVRFTFICKNAKDSFCKYLISNPFKDIKELKDLIQEELKNSNDKLHSDNNELFNNHIKYSKEYLKLIDSSDPVLLITNGRVTRNLLSITPESLNILNIIELKKSENILDILHLKDEKHSLSSSSKKNTLVMIIYSIFNNHIKNPAVERKSLPDSIKPSFSVVKDSLLKFSMVLNPFSKTTQKLTPMIEGLSKYLDISVDVVLNPPLSVSEFPMKNYYHYVMQLDMNFDKTTGSLLSAQTSGTITNLPESRVLTLAFDAPGSWLVQPIVAKYDLDNIRLKDLGEEQILNAIFELENLVIEGSCLDVSTHTPPAGLEIELSPIATKSKVNQDTIVMSNLGYYQLKSNPGIWTLSIKEGRSSDLLSIYDNDKKSKIKHHSVIIDNLFVPTDSLFVIRKPGKEYENLLAEDDKSTSGTKNSINQPVKTSGDSISSMFSNFFSKGNKKSIEEKKKEISSKTNSDSDLIHIFSVASGHLYERFLKIMMLSVTKNSNSPVKFWFLKNYLSPGFKEFIPKMAEELGFQYELVTYKWPWWLRKQTEKQRIIWGYKMLFLDVLFPLDVKKIIFVDADQVVRTDMKELWDMNLEGASLGLTPFCDSNKETEGFRFWKQGYWRDHLRGKPYHISALYVVDLLKFRRISAGDQIRATYDQLSRDPGSLANLDQDLPNYLQHQIRIFSLPQEWLWCETWCDQTSKTKAKTIDLCNNPLTKTPKLQNAVRIISEWTSLDNEAKDLDIKFEKEKSLIESTTITTSTNTDNNNNKVGDKFDQQLQELILESIDEAQNIL